MGAQSYEIIIVDIYVPLIYQAVQYIITLVINACVHLFHGQATYYFDNWCSHSVLWYTLQTTKYPTVHVHTWVGRGGRHCMQYHLHTMLTELERESNPWLLPRSRLTTRPIRLRYTCLPTYVDMNHPWFLLNTKDLYISWSFLKISSYLKFQTTPRLFKVDFKRPPR